MPNKPINIAIAVTGASGAIYAKVLFDTMVQHKNLFKNIAVVMSDNAKYVWQYELDNTDYKNYPFTFFDKNDFMAPFASGSSSYQALIICPCSMGTLGRIATGISNDLVTRAADVMLKERRKLVLLTRDTPLNLIHIKNMETITLAGGIVCPATPSFYSKPKTFEELAKTVTDRALHLAGIEITSFRWNEEGKE
ncbi:MAG TPA: UbiX family flavin prenyltransferase [Bacteroidia bacterium]|nr:UbiX family flavin prenyltransferase [Bacteroidia bacterium]